MQEQEKHKEAEASKILTRRDKAEQFVQSVSSMAWLLLRLNVMFLIFSAAVVTAPASLSAMTKVLMNIVRNDDFELWNDFWREFKISFRKSLAAGLISAALIAAIFFFGFAVYTSFGGFIGSLGIAVIIVFGIILYFGLCYLFPLIVTVDLSLKQCISNSLALALIELKHNALLLMPLVLFAACTLLFPVSLPLLILIAFSLHQYIVCRIVTGVIQKRIIDPYYQGAR